MRFLPRISQRVFAYAIFLVLASHVISFMVFRFWAEHDLQIRLVTEVANNAAAALDGQDGDSVRTLLTFFNRQPHKLWVEQPDGEIIAGNPEPGLSFGERRSLKKVNNPGSLVRIINDRSTDYTVAEVPIRLAEGEAIICMRWGRPPGPPLWALFMQGLIAVCIIGGVLSFWAARRIARPLGELRSKVLEIAAGNLETRVSERGPVEIAMVGRAVNSMAQSLSSYISGMRELVANISHEMRSPLARLSISATIIEEGLAALVFRNGRIRNQNEVEQENGPPLILDSSGNPLAVKHVQDVMYEIEHMEKLVGSSLLHSKLDMQQTRPRLQPVDFSSLTGDMAFRCQSMMEQKKLRFTQELQPDLWVDGDDALLPLVISNLLDNASKYTDEGGVVMLKLFATGGEVVLELENSLRARHTLDEAVLPRLFEPFFKGGLADDYSEGVGLGLSLVKKIAECHNGCVGAQNSGIGLKFSVRLPRSGFRDWMSAQIAV